MKKLKGFYHNNRIYCILMIVSILCILVIGVLLLLYFINQTKNDKYGKRLSGIESVEISKDHKEEINSFISEQEIVEKSTINIEGKIIYVNVCLKDGKVGDAQNIAIKSLEKLTEDEKNFYDINFTFVKEVTNDKGEKDETFPIMGYKKSDKTIISWTKVTGE